jgi:DNA repair exonuclease SbcCD nuclease subunit
MTGVHAVVTADSHLHTSGRYLAIDGQALAAYRERRWRAFESVVAAAIDGEADLFLHCGDLFDVADPGTDALARVVRRLGELEAAGVTPVVIPGNHDYSRVEGGEEVTDPAATTPVDLLAAAGVGVAFTDTDRVAATTVECGGETLWVAGLGYDPTLEGDTDPLAGTTPAPAADHSVLLTHHCIEGHEWGLEGWPTVGRETIHGLGVDAVCSGHVHARAEMAVGDTRVVVPGTIDRRDFGEADVTPGYYTLTWDDGVEAAAHALDARPVVDERVAAADLPEGAETAALAGRVREWATPDALLRVSLDDPAGVIDRAAVRRAGRVACHLAVVDA